MTLSAPTYDLVLLLDPQADQDTRAKILASAREAIEARGELLRHDEWGDRALAYPIDHKTGAEYHLLQFHATPELLDTLNRTLRIADEVVRFRVIKLAPGTPDAPEVSAVGGAAQQIEAEPVVEIPAEVEIEVEVEVAAEAEVAAGEPV